MKPRIRAEGIVMKTFPSPFSDKPSGPHVLVQCDQSESFYRFPGGTIEFGETAENTIMRELQEEFNLDYIVGDLAAISENLFEYDTRKRHDVTLIHWCTLAKEKEMKMEQVRWHNEHSTVKLVWRTLNKISSRPLYPTGILDVLRNTPETAVHLVNKRMND